jgi:hypothetical protein
MGAPAAGAVMAEEAPINSYREEKLVLAAKAGKAVREVVLVTSR